jgi:hypothetical protein
MYNPWFDNGKGKCMWIWRKGESKYLYMTTSINKNPMQENNVRVEQNEKASP